MLFDFFPSRTLTWYLARTFVTRILAVLVMLVLVLMMLDLLTTTADILAYPGNGEGELLRYVGLRVPQLIARFLPYSVLLATIITLATFNQNSEVVAMKAAGLSAHQILAPLLLAAGLVSLTSFAFNERVVTRATATLSAWQAVNYGPIPRESEVRSNIYLAVGDDILEAAGVSAPTAYALALSADGYSTNVPFNDLTNGRAMVALRYEGQPIHPEHSGPARLIVPHLYFWKSAKWISGLQLLEHDQPGFWESLGYHLYGDPWKEQRYHGQ